MRKVIIFLILIAAGLGCSVLRVEKYGEEDLSAISSSEVFMRNIIKQNLTSQSFFIQKALIQLSAEGGKEKFLANVKFQPPDTFLISLRMNNGIEVLRIFTSNDTIIILDRIKRKQYYGSDQYLIKRFGLSTNILPLIFGDFISSNYYDNAFKCSKGKSNMIEIINEAQISYVIDCNKMKCTQANIEFKANTDRIGLFYSNFTKNGGVRIPGKILITDRKNEIELLIEIKKYLFPWNGNVELTSGTKYEMIQLK